MPLVLSLARGVGVLVIDLSATRRAVEPRPAVGTRLLTPVDDLLRQAGVEGVRPRTFLLLSLAAGASVSGFAQTLLGWPVVSAAAFVVGAALPAWYLRNRREARQAELQAALADAVDALRAAVRAGLSVEEGLATLARHGPDPLRPALRDLTRDLRLSGFEAAVRRCQARLADPMFDTVAAALVMAHHVGGRNLGSVLDSLGRAVRGAARVEREVRAQQARNVLSARIVAALPLGLIAAIRSLNPNYLDPFSDPVGQVLLALCLVSVAAGYAVMLRAARLPTLRTPSSGRRQP